MLPRFHFSIERWKKNEEYGVWVSNQGRIRLIKNKEYLPPRIGSNGYSLVFTNKGLMSVHRLVALTWMKKEVEKHDNKFTVDHINSNKRDNSVKNLRVVSEKVNKEYAIFTSSSQSEVFNEDLIKSILDPVYPIINRITEFIEALDAGKITVKYYSTMVHSVEELQNLRRKYASAADDTKFYTKILNVANTSKDYCGALWRIQLAQN